MKRKLLLAAAVGLMLIISAAAIASNMGFKIVIPLTAGYANYVSLPYYNSYTNANSIFNDISNCTAVKRWDNGNGVIQQWSGTRGQNFSVTPGEAYIINVNANVNWVVVGSHNPSLGVTLTSGYANYVSVPYHATATNANSLFHDISNCIAVKRWDNTNGVIQQWSGTRGTNFTLTPGEGLIVNVNTTVPWTPSHY